jgi:hypothetical protein
MNIHIMSVRVKMQYYYMNLDYMTILVLKLLSLPLNVMGISMNS